MFRFDNTHIFTGYLKQFLASFNLPTCKVYSNEFLRYFEQHGKEDPRILESFDPTGTVNANGEVTSLGRCGVRINYLKNDKPYAYFSNGSSTPHIAVWKCMSDVFYDSTKTVRGLTKKFNNHSIYYDTETHEYLGEYLRFLRDYHDINLMSLYNCFNNKSFSNIYYSFERANGKMVTFNSQAIDYRLYAIPVKLFSKYTIAIDCEYGVELFCGLYGTAMDTSTEAKRFSNKTYVKTGKTMFKQPFLYDKLDVEHWPAKNDYTEKSEIRTDALTRWDLTMREKDLKLFIKVPVSCKSSITILEGDYRNFNDAKYTIKNGKWVYTQNSSKLNFNERGDGIDLNSYKFEPISKVQLLAMNTGISYPFSDRLVEYMIGSAITPLDPIPDNIIRTQRVMAQNGHYFSIEGVWEDKMQNILYDYIINSGPVVVTNNKLCDRRSGLHPRLGHTSRSTLYDILGYVDKDAEKWYANWIKTGDKSQAKDTIQNVDIYNGLFDI